MGETQTGTNHSGRTYDWRLCTRLLRYIRPYRRSVFLAFFLTILNAPLSTVGPLLTKAAIDLFLVPDVSRPPSGYVLWVKHGAELVGWGGSKSHGLIFVAILFMLCNIAKSVAQYCQVMLTQTVGQNAIHDLRRELFSHLHRLPAQFFDQKPAGGLVTRLTSDIDAISQLFNTGIFVLLGQLTTAVYTLAWMIRLNWSLALLTCSVLLVMTAFTAWFRAAIRPSFRRVRERLAAINAFVQEHLMGMHIVKIFNRESEELERFNSINHTHWRAAASVTLGNAVFYPAIEGFALIGIALIIWYGGGQVMGRVMGLGSLVAFIQLAQSFFDPVIEIGSRYHALHTALTSVERVFELLDEPIEKISLQEPAQLGVASGRIEFRNVWFAYQPGEWILRDVSFTVEPGEKVAFIGRTGAGKTTITNLLLRFYEIQRGQILLDNVDIREIDPEEVRSNFAIVPQELALFSGDVISNIRLGNRSISEEAVKIAAREVHLDEFVSKLERGYESKLLESGANLSVGQKQLVSFARALAFDRPILILDEATSSIDTQTESLICDAVQRIMKGRTAVLIAHRLSTIQSADKIFVMHEGRIHECGNHQSLLAQRGLYWRLCQLQLWNDSTRMAEITSGD
jgi:ATP-binding cassette, subfamily B, multidrug efflux pump